MNWKCAFENVHICTYVKMLNENDVLMSRFMMFFLCPCICVTMHLRNRVHVYSRNVSVRVHEWRTVCQLYVYRDCYEPYVDFHDLFCQLTCVIYRFYYYLCHLPIGHLAALSYDVIRQCKCKRKCV